MTLEPWQERVIKERAELYDRVRSLTDFIDARTSQVTPREFTDLEDQEDAMYRYLSILDRRIARFSEEG